MKISVHKQESDVEKVLKLKGGRATQTQIVKALGYRPNFERLEHAALIRRPDGCPNHFELVPPQVVVAA